MFTWVAQEIKGDRLLAGSHGMNMCILDTFWLSSCNAKSFEEASYTQTLSNELSLSLSEAHQTNPL